MSRSEPRIVFIGAGHHARWTLYPCLQFVPQANLVGVCDLNEDTAQTVARQFGAGAVYTDYRHMLNREKPDAVLCCGGPKLHAAVIAEAIDRDLPLFVEKPPASSASELLPLVEAGERRKSLVMVGFMRRFAPLVTWTRKAISSDGFGQTMMLYGREGIWASDPANVVLDSGIHVLDLLRFLGGDVASVFAARHTDGSYRTGVVLVLRFANGLVGHASLNSLESFSVPNNVVEVHGSEGGFIRIDNWAKAVWHRDSGGLSCPGEPEASSLVYEQPWNQANVNRASRLQGYIPEFEHFFACVASGDPPLATLRDGYRALQLVEAVNESIHQQKEIAIQ